MFVMSVDSNVSLRNMDFLILVLWSSRSPLRWESTYWNKQWYRKDEWVPERMSFVFELRTVCCSRRRAKAGQCVLVHLITNKVKRFSALECFFLDLAVHYWFSRTLLENGVLGSPRTLVTGEEMRISNCKLYIIWGKVRCDLIHVLSQDNDPVCFYVFLLFCFSFAPLDRRCRSLPPWAHQVWTSASAFWNLKVRPNQENSSDKSTSIYLREREREIFSVIRFSVLEHNRKELINHHAVILDMSVLSCASSILASFLCAFFCSQSRTGRGVTFQLSSVHRVVYFELCDVLSVCLLSVNDSLYWLIILDVSFVCVLL